MILFEKKMKRKTNKNDDFNFLISPMKFAFVLELVDDTFVMTLKKKKK